MLKHILKILKSGIDLKDFGQQTATDASDTGICLANNRFQVAEEIATLMDQIDSRVREFF